MERFSAVQAPRSLGGAGGLALTTPPPFMPRGPQLTKARFVDSGSTSPTSHSMA